MVYNNHDKAQILVEALPYIRKYAGKTVVIKYGGAAMVDPEIRAEFMKDVVLMKYIGIRPIIVHGGGPEINAMLTKIGKQSHFIDGNRVSDKEIVEIAEMVLSAKVNKSIVTDLQLVGGMAIGLSGKDGNLLHVRKKYIEKEGEKIDIGFVGEVTKVNREIIDMMLENDYIPVISSIGTDKAGNTYNINADYVAGAVAGALNAHRLIFLTDVDGVFRDFNDPSTLIADMSVTEALDHIETGVINGGMLPKVGTCLKAIEKGVSHVIILNGKTRHSILLELFTEEGCGTMIYRDEEGID